MSRSTSGLASGSVPKLRKALKKTSPGLHYERGCWEAGHRFVAGVDEVGRGAWAGPLTVGVAVIPRDRRIYKVRDSKMLNEAEREALFDRVTEWCDAWAVGHASEVECDEIGMSAAQKLAAKRALDGVAASIGSSVDHVLIDGNWDFVGDGRAGSDARTGGGAAASRTITKIVKGDATCLSIAAASIIAKVTRDRLMRSMAVDYPGYFFEDNKGYPCPRHRAALSDVGPCTAHRHSWAFIDALPRNGVELRRRQQTLFDSE